MVFHVPKGRMVFAAALRGGGGARFRLKVWQSRFSAICLIPLWLSAVNRPGSLRTREKGGDESDPPQTGGGM